MKPPINWRCSISWVIKSKWTELNLALLHIIVYYPTLHTRHPWALAAELDIGFQMDRQLLVSKWIVNYWFPNGSSTVDCGVRCCFVYGWITVPLLPISPSSLFPCGQLRLVSFPDHFSPVWWKMSGNETKLGPQCTRAPIILGVPITVNVYREFATADEGLWIIKNRYILPLISHRTLAKTSCDKV